MNDNQIPGIQFFEASNLAAALYMRIRYGPENKQNKSRLQHTLAGPQTDTFVRIHEWVTTDSNRMTGRHFGAGKKETVVTYSSRNCNRLMRIKDSAMTDLGRPSGRNFKIMKKNQSWQTLAGTETGTNKYIGHGRLRREP